jgi:hypothetical protein
VADPRPQPVRGIALATFAKMLDELDQAGGGAPLSTYNGRDALRDVAEGLVNAFQNCIQAGLENSNLAADLVNARASITQLETLNAALDKRVIDLEAENARLGNKKGRP